MTSLSSRAVVTAEERGYTAGIGNNLLFEARLIEGADAVLDAVASASACSEFGVFQTGPWLLAVYGDLAPGHQAWPLAVEVRTASVELALFLPLLATREKGLDVLRVPSLWVSDYGGPLVGPAAPADDAGAAALWRPMKCALAGDDLIIVENMPHSIGERSNPLALTEAARPVEHQRNALHIEGSVEDMLRARGKKYRKEAERCARLLAERGTPTFKRAESQEEIAHGYAILQEQQALRRRAAGGGTCSTNRTTCVSTKPCCARALRMAGRTSSPWEQGPKLAPACLG
jgi:CelD/BcsL family acetyltransferase involved in cellulose biosynthesis